MVSLSISVEMDCVWSQYTRKYLLSKVKLTLSFMLCYSEPWTCAYQGEGIGVRYTPKIRQQSQGKTEKHGGEMHSVGLLIKNDR